MSSFKYIKTSINNSELLKHNIIFFVGSLGIAIFNYTYYPVVSRLVSVPSFGEIQAVISIFMQLGIILTAFGYVITNLIANTKNREESSELILRLEQLMMVLCGFVFVALVAGSYLFQSSLKLSSIVPILLVGLLIIVNVPSTSRTYVLQGMKKLAHVSISGILFSVGKLILTVVLIFALTNDVIAAVSGYIVAQIITLFYLAWKVNGKYVKISKTFSFIHFRNLDNRLRSLIRFELIYGLVITVILSGLTLLYSSDTVIARLFFDPHTLGIYSGISSVARIVFFVTASIAGVLVASVTIGGGRQKNLRILSRSLLLICSIGGAAVMAFALFPSFFVTLLVGGSYQSGAYLLPLLSFVMLVCSVNNLLAIYQIALRRYRTIWPVAIGVVALGILLTFYHTSLLHFISSLLIANIIVCVLLITQIILEDRSGS